MSESHQDISRILRAVNDGDDNAESQLFEAVYDQLHLIAQRKMAREGPGHTLQATALVNEAYLKLVAGDDRHWQNRNHFFAAAVQAMRRILIDRYRRVSADKRGGDQQRQLLHNGIAAPADSLDVVAFDEALQGLAEFDARAAEIVRYRFFLGLTEEETAEVLDVSRSTVTKQWRQAKAWLSHKLEDWDNVE